MDGDSLTDSLQPHRFFRKRVKPYPLLTHPEVRNYAGITSDPTGCFGFLSGTIGQTEDLLTL